MCAIFADDTKIYRQINSPSDVHELQSDLDKVHRWGDQNGLKFNENKCSVITIKRARPKPSIDSCYTMNETPIAKDESIKDLGVYIDPSLKWNYHIETCVKKANSRMWLLV